MMLNHFIIEWLRVDGLYKIPRGLHTGVGLHTILHFMGAVRHHRWLTVSPEGQLAWFWLRRTGPAGGVIGQIDEVKNIKPSGLALERGLRFECGSRKVDTYGPRVEIDRLVTFLDRA